MSTVHVAPVGDTIDHHIPGGWLGHGVDCPCDGCEPGCWITIETVTDGDDSACLCTPELAILWDNADGPEEWMVTHHARDGREQRQAERNAGLEGEA